jgi:tRNA threonylcarbamoyladenosine biosynthesis protein TsaE
LNENRMSESADETRAIGRELATSLRGGDVVLLSGDLGAGKTELTKGIAAGLGVPDLVQSPTFALVDEHPGPRPRPRGPADPPRSLPSRPRRSSTASAGAS